MSRVGAAALTWDAGEIIHVVVSPPPALARAAVRTVAGYRKLRREASTIAKDAGMTGGAIIVHPWRCKFQGRGRYERAARVTGGLELSPHFHVVGTGWIEWGHQNYRRTGWVVKNLRVRKSVGGTVSYLATHCGVVPSVPTITYFGNAHPQKTELVDERMELVVGVCECGGTLLEWNADLSFDRGGYFERIVHRSYAAKGKGHHRNRFNQRAAVAWTSDGTWEFGWVGNEHAVPGSPAWWAPRGQTVRLDGADLPECQWA